VVGQDFLFWILKVCIVSSFIVFDNVRYRNNLKPMSPTLQGDASPRTFEMCATPVHKREHVCQWVMYKRGCRVVTSSSKLKTVPLKIVLLYCDHNVKRRRKEIIFFCETCFRIPGLHPGKYFKHITLSLTYWITDWLTDQLTN